MIALTLGGDGAILATADGALRIARRGRKGTDGCRCGRQFPCRPGPGSGSWPTAPRGPASGNCSRRRCRCRQRNGAGPARRRRGALSRPSRREIRVAGQRADLGRVTGAGPGFRSPITSSSVIWWNRRRISDRAEVSGLARHTTSSASSTVRRQRGGRRRRGTASTNLAGCAGGSPAARRAWSLRSQCRHRPR